MSSISLFSLYFSPFTDPRDISASAVLLPKAPPCSAFSYSVLVSQLILVLLGVVKYVSPGVRYSHGVAD